MTHPAVVHASASARRMLRVLPACVAVLSTGGGVAAQEVARVPVAQADLLQAADAARSKGQADAPIRIVEISDFECPFCARFHRQAYREIDSVYVDGGFVRYLWISFPNSRHPRAWPAIEAAFCAGAAGRFWEMHELLFENQESWTKADDPDALFRGYADRIGVEAAGFEACVERDLTAPLQVSDYDAALRSGITSTPFFVVGDSLAIRGAVTVDEFRAAVDSVLSARGHGVP